MVKLHQMSQLVSQASDITERELKFIEAYPLHSLLETQAAGLLEEAKQIMENLVSTPNHDYFVVKIFLDSFAYNAKMKCAKIYVHY